MPKTRNTESPSDQAVELSRTAHTHEGKERGVDTGQGVSSWNGSREQYDRLHGRHGYSDRVLAGRHRRYFKEFTKKAAAREHYSQADNKNPLLAQW